MYFISKMAFLRESFRDGYERFGFSPVKCYNQIKVRVKKKRYAFKDDWNKLGVIRIP